MKRDLTHEEMMRKMQEPEDGAALAGTASEQAPGTGGGGTHPAPAAMIVDGRVRQHGEGPNTAGGTAPTVEQEEAWGGGLTPEAAKELGREQDSADQQQKTDRADLGTPD